MMGCSAGGPDDLLQRSSSVRYRREMNAPKDLLVPKTVFPVVDIATAIDFYCTLGFHVVSYDETYAWVQHHGVEILHLALVEDLDVAANASACYLHVQHADDWHSAWREAGVAVGEIADQPWQMREFAIRDPSNNLLRIGHNLG
jgi:catechol 2,3-dioxygenase-like lactoylglutathione lyase family enzyme